MEGVLTTVQINAKLIKFMMKFRRVLIFHTKKGSARLISRILETYWEITSSQDHGLYLPKQT
jgi:hypothetical protein